MRWVSMLPAAARRLIPPLALTTRCQGTPGGQWRIAVPTMRARRGQPSHAAIWPYVATLPLGIFATSRQTRR